MGATHLKDYVILWYKQDYLVFLVDLRRCHRLDLSCLRIRLTLGQQLSLGRLRWHGGLLGQPIAEPVSGGQEYPPVEQEDDHEGNVERRHRGKDLVADVLTHLKCA